MSHRTSCYILSAVALALPLMFGAALAGDRISSTIIEAPSHAGDFHLTKAGNSLTIAPAPASAPGTLAVMTLKLKNVDCALEGNDNNVTGKCGPVGTGVDAVLDFVIHNTIAGDVRVGIPIEFVKGRATFIASEKNKIDATSALPLLPLFLTPGSPVSFDALNIREEGSNPTDCGTIPAGSGCVDGNEFAFTGIHLGM